MRVQRCADSRVKANEIFGGADGETSENFEQWVDVGAADVEGGDSHVGAWIPSGVLRGGVDGHDPISRIAMAEDFAEVGAPPTSGGFEFRIGDRATSGENGLEAGDGFGRVIEGHAVIFGGNADGVFGMGAHHRIERVEGRAGEIDGFGHAFQEYRSGWRRAGSMATGARRAQGAGTGCGSAMYL